MSTIYCEQALINGVFEKWVLFEVEDGIIRSWKTGAVADGADLYLTVAVPAFSNTHSHLFHRALRGNGKGEDFWAWREGMYAVANKLTPDTYYELARGVYAEMAAAGYSSVGEFHYVHHDPQGNPYPEHDMERAIMQAAQDIGIRLTLLDTCYLHGGFGKELSAEQQRFSDGSVERWVERWHSLAEAAPSSPLVTVGAALHSVRAMTGEELTYAAEHLPADIPLHIHVSEQPQENADCLAATGLTPIQLLQQTGVLSPRTTAVHATHLTDGDIRIMAESGCSVSICPSTEADLGDGIARLKDMLDAGIPLTIGSDENVVTDPFLELRMLESTARLASGTRGVISSQELWGIGSNLGIRSVRPADYTAQDAPGFTQGGAADFVEIGMDSPRLAGVEPLRLPIVATADDISATVVAGKLISADTEAYSLATTLEKLR